MIRVHKVNILRLFKVASFFGYQTLISKAWQHILRARFVNIKASLGLLLLVEPMKRQEYNRKKCFA